jgi:hypothetical protein
MLVGHSQHSSLTMALRSAPRFALPNPVGDETGLLLLLASLDQVRQRQRDVEQGWQIWGRRAAMGLVQAEGADAALAAIRDGEASDALVLGPLPVQASLATVIGELPPIPHTLGLVKGAPHEPQARRLLAWLTSADAAAAVEGGGGLSGWPAQENGLAVVAASSRPLDVGWGFDQYRSVRAEWGRKPWAVRVPASGR